MKQEEVYALMIVNIIGVFLFGRLYFGSFKKTLIALINLLGSHDTAGLRGSMSNPEPSELFFVFFCVMLISGEMVWLFLP